MNEHGGRRAGEVEQAFAEARRAMVDVQLARRGIRDPRILDAMAHVPRHEFVGAEWQTVAYEDRPLPIGFGQTISQPFMVARATELAQPQPRDRALEIGAGCGYQTAVLAELTAEVFAVEVVPELAARAMATLADLHHDNAQIAAFDGSGGWPEHAPYDVIVVSAAAPRIPVLLLDQLRDGGRLVLPVGTEELQVLTCVRRHGADYEIIEDTRCRYVDLIGRYGMGASTPQC